MRINGSGVYLHPDDQRILDITHTDHYPFFLKGHLTDIVRECLTRSVELEIAEFDELREAWDTYGYEEVHEAFERGSYEIMPTVPLAYMLISLESIACDE